MGVIRCILCVAGAGAVAYWALTTKNEVVEAIVFPLKVKLGMAEYKVDDSSIVAERHTNDVGDLSIWDKYGSSLPPIFNRTIYRSPTEIELREVAQVKMSPDDIIKGLTYTIVGRGLPNPKSNSIIAQAISRLIAMCPDRAEYKVCNDIASRVR